MREVSRSRPLLLCALVALATLLPYLYGLALTPAGQRFLWTRQVNRIDLAAHLAYLERAGAGEHPPANPYQPEPPAAVPLRPTYDLLGLLVQAGLPAQLVLHGARLGLGFLLLLATWRLAAALFEGERSRLEGFTLAALGSGVSWAADLASESPLQVRGFADAVQAEATLFSSLFEVPHRLLGQWLLVEAVLAAVLAARAPAEASVRWLAARLALAAAFLAPDSPFLLPALGIGVGLGLVCCRAPGSGWRRPAGMALALGLGAIPAALIPISATLADPSYAAWNEGMEAPGVGDLFLGVAPLWMLAVIGVAEGEGPAWRRWFLLLWALSFWALVLGPFPQARRMVTGWTVPLGLLAAGGLEALRARWPEWRSPARLALALACAGSLHLVLVQLAAYHERPRATHWFPAARWDGLAELRGRLDLDDVAVADGETSLWLPAIARCRTVHGHPFQGRAPRERYLALAAAIESGNQLGRPPAPGGELRRVRAIVAVRPGPDADPLVWFPEPDGSQGTLWSGRPTWGPPAFRNEDVEVFLLER